MGKEEIGIELIDANHTVGSLTHVSVRGGGGKTEISLS